MVARRLARRPPVSAVASKARRAVATRATRRRLPRSSSINRAPHLGDEIRWDALRAYDPYEAFRQLFNSDNVGKQSYFDLMTHFDFRTLLPALLQVEDRMSMAHGLESRVPLLDHPLVEFVATIPADVKFRNGRLKQIFEDVEQGTTRH